MKLRLHCMVYALLAAASLWSGCIKQALPPAVEFRISELATAPLRGKTIVLDPGHGGPERGAIAENGLCEAEVNMGVALYLWGLLKDAGAQPVLTRNSDTCLFKGEPFVLRGDLEARAAVSNAAKADLFVSIHHNSDGKERGERNDLMVFYKMSDPGCSRDVAREVCDALKERMQAEPASVRPGNYLVLRNTQAPAILGEASYMNYKSNSEKLSYHRTLNAEAQGYFMGILNYYAKGVPAVSFFAPSQPVFIEARPRIAASLSAGAPGAALDRASLKARLDGRPAVGLVFDNAGTVSFTPQAPLPNGAHEFCLDVRNAAGNAAQKACSTFTVAVPPARMSVQPVFAVVPSDGEAAAPVDIEVFDRLGRPVADNTQVELETSAGRFAAAVVETKNGRARAFLRAETCPQQAVITARAGDIRQRCTLSFGTPQEALFAAEIKDAGGKPVEGAALVRADREVSLSDAAGRVFDRVGSSGTVGYTIRRKGYEPVRVSVALAAGKLVPAGYRLQPVDRGVFFNRTVMLDAAGQSQASLPLLRELRSMIEHAGGTAMITWETLPAPTAQGRVMKAAEAKADLFISVFTGSKAPAAEYYYKSVQGAGLADAVCRSLNELKPFGRKTCEARPGTEYVLMHTAMTALLLRLPAAMNISARDAAASLYGAIGKMLEKSLSGL
ncbi:MAG: N-acetylmuramoyl-L-alanine amidase [Deltaproteobacteria bacterium]|nr:N-acetylmuramoyl-L-alanine amidase [Deltaproteobacteria bacterium]